MPIPAPILDDRSYQQLRDELVRRIPVYTPEWTDHNASDPGITLIELFAFLGENLLFRFNQIPEATKLAFLRLLQIPLLPAVPAHCMLAMTTEEADGALIAVGAEARAGSIPFETINEVEAWPISVVAGGRVTTAAPDMASESEPVEFALRALDAIGGLKAGETPAYYATQLLPTDDRHLYAESYLVDTLAVKMGGRVAERLIRGEASSGAADDLASATALAIQMVRELGLSDAIGPVSYAASPDRPAVIAGPRSHSEQTQWRLDQEVTSLLTGAEARARELLTRHLPALRQLTALLLEQETVSGDQVRALVATGHGGYQPLRPESLPADASYVSVD